MRRLFIVWLLLGYLLNSCVLLAQEGKTTESLLENSSQKKFLNLSVTLKLPALIRSRRMYLGIGMNVLCRQVLKTIAILILQISNVG